MYSKRIVSNYKTKLTLPVDDEDDLLTKLIKQIKEKTEEPEPLRRRLQKRADLAQLQHNLRQNANSNLSNNGLKSRQEFRNESKSRFASQQNENSNTNLITNRSVKNIIKRSLESKLSGNVHTHRVQPGIKSQENLRSFAGTSIKVDP